MYKVKVSTLSWALVILQFTTLIYLFTSRPYVAHSMFGLLTQMLGVVIGIWAIFSMGLLNFSVFPEPKDKVRLVTAGCYHYIRHPMYASVLLVTIPLLVDYFSIVRLLVFLVLCVVGYLKIQIEEQALMSRFPEYKSYSQHTNRLLPFVW